jgi:hypothetical protein
LLGVWIGATSVDSEDIDREDGNEACENPGEEGAEKEEEERKEEDDLREGLTNSPDFFRMTLGVSVTGGREEEALRV